MCSMRTSSLPFTGIFVTIILYSRVVSAFEPGMQGHHRQDDRADEYIVGKTRHTDKDDAVAHHTQDQHADNGANDRATPASKGCTADDDHRNDFQFVASAAVGIRGCDAD